VLALGMLAWTGCSGSENAREKPPDQRYDHRYEATGPDERVTLIVTAPSAAEYGTYDVPVEEVIVRAASFEKGASDVPADLLVKGALPNDCLALHEAQQERDGHFVGVTLEMRWPSGQGRTCERVRRPFRFYFPLPGRYAPGDYTLKLNGTAYPFSVRRDD
jgi:hypothetical protein